ncbi:MAG: hypothetical protein JSS81_22820 [Acidobacteria bacterium]|nr:hypothetical protein [Acidobacteriota bacterium]
MKCELTVECADIARFSCDVLVLKFAQSFYGADWQVANLLKPQTLGEIAPAADEFVLLPANRRLAAEKVLFVGVVRLQRFDYEQIRKFAAHSLEILADAAPEAKHIAMTVHGVGAGLDERESFLAQVAGLLDALNADAGPRSLERITIVEINPRRATRLRQILDNDLKLSAKATESRSLSTRSPESLAISSAGAGSNAKPHVFVAMPFSKEMEDVYRFGIQNPVNAAGFLCERVDMAIFTGDIVARIKSRIETAALVIADLTGANANVYLEVGYAWGKNRPTLLLAKNLDDLKFDVKGERCIIYENISDLERKLQADLAALK